VSKEYPMDRKQQNTEDQDRMSRILKRRAEEVDSKKKTDGSSENDEPPSETSGRARAASG
jgi:hypothetical protein